MAGALLFYSGGAENKFAVGSIGGARSTTPIPDAQLENLFDDVNRVEIINGRIEYRCFFIKNDDAQDYYRTTLKSITIPANTELAFALDGVSGDTPQLLATEDSTPVGLRFFDFSKFASFRLPIGQFEQTGAQNEIALWIRRKTTLGVSGTKTILITIDGTDNGLTITQDFNTVKSSVDNWFATTRSDQFFTDEDFVGEALTT